MDEDTKRRLAKIGVILGVLTVVLGLVFILFKLLIPKRRN